MNRNAMINDALNQGTLVIMESGKRGVVGTRVRDLGDRMVIKVIRARGLRAGERVTAPTSVVTPVTGTMVETLRADMATWEWADADAAMILAAPVSKIIGHVRRAYGSWAEGASYFA
jgi:hypothetical protein